MFSFSDYAPFPTDRKKYSNEDLREIWRKANDLLWKIQHDYRYSRRGLRACRDRLRLIEAELKRRGARKCDRNGKVHADTLGKVHGGLGGKVLPFRPRNMRDK